MGSDRWGNKDHRDCYNDEEKKFDATWDRTYRAAEALVAAEEEKKGDDMGREAGTKTPPAENKLELPAQVEEEKPAAHEDDFANGPPSPSGHAV